MNKTLIFASVFISFGAMANQYNPYMPYEKPKLLLKENVNPIELGMSEDAEYLDENGNSISISGKDMVYIMELDGVEIYLDQKTGTYINKISGNNDNN